MSTQELKNLIHESVENIDDKSFLDAINSLLQRKYQSATQPVLSDHLLKRIKESKEQIQQGRSFSNTEADKLVDEWLTKN